MAPSVVSGLSVPGYFVARSGGGFKFGDPAVVPPGIPMSADGKAVVGVGGGVAFFVEYVIAATAQTVLDGAVKDPARLLALRTSACGDRCGTWTSVAEESRSEEFGVWPVPQLTTTLRLHSR